MREKLSFKLKQNTGGRQDDAQRREDSRTKTLAGKNKDNAGHVNVAGRPNTCGKTQEVKVVNGKWGLQVNNSYHVQRGQQRSSGCLCHTSTLPSRPPAAYRPRAPGWFLPASADTCCWMTGLYPRISKPHRLQAWWSHSIDERSPRPAFQAAAGSV